MSLIGHFYGKLIYDKTQPEVLVNLHLTNIPNASLMQQHKTITQMEVTQFQTLPYG
jgi:hypothetical protein